MSASTPRLVVLISGTGRNLQAIAEATLDGRLDAEIAAVVSNRPDAYGLHRAEHLGIPTRIINHRDYSDRGAFDAALEDAVAAFRPDLVALAGFMRILGRAFIARFRGRMLNIHPSMLPLYPGLHTHERALQAGDAWHGASVHFVTDTVDGGPLILQGRISIAPGDDPDSLAKRLIQEVETRIYPLALQWLAESRLTLRDDQAVLDGRPLDEPVQWTPEAGWAEEKNPT